MKIKLLTFVLIITSTLSNWAQTTPLIKAIKTSDLPKVKKLVTNGSDINALDEQGATPLMWAAFSADFEMFEYLVANGADPSIKKGGIYPFFEKRGINLDNSQLYGSDAYFYGNLTSIAVGEGKFELLKYLIEELGIDIEDRGYNPTTNKVEGKTAAKYIPYAPNDQIFTYLIAKGAKIPPYINDFIKADSALLQKNKARFDVIFEYEKRKVKEANKTTQRDQNSGINYILHLKESFERYKQGLEIKSYEGNPVNDQSLLYSTIQKIIEIDSLYLNALKTYKQQLDNEYPDHTFSLLNLGRQYTAIDLYDEAESIFKTYLKICGKKLREYSASNKYEIDEAHYHYVNGLYALGNLYSQRLGQYKDAKLLFEKALVIREKSLGAQHPHYASSLTKLGHIYKKLGSYQEAKNNYKSALEIYKNAPGKDSLDLAAAIDNLAALYTIDGQYDTAEIYFKQAKAMKKTESAKNESLVLLAALYTDMGRYKEAELLLKKVENAQKWELQTPYNILAELYKNTGRYKEAEPLYLEAIKVDKLNPIALNPVLGADYLQLANLYLMMERIPQADTLIQKAFHIFERLGSRLHPDYVRTQHYKAILLSKSGKLKEAEKLFEEVLQKQNVIYSKDNPSYALTLGETAHLYVKTNQYEKAEKAYLTSSKILKRILGGQHPQYLQNMNELAGLYQKTFQYNKAALIYTQIQQISNQLLKKEQVGRQTTIPRNLKSSIEEGQVFANNYPFINIYSPDPLQKNERGSILLNSSNFTLKGFVHATYGIQEFFVNDDSVTIFPDGLWQFPIKLEKGENAIVIKALANSGEKTIDTLNLIFESRDITINKAPQKYLLAIGIDNYAFENWKSLNMPVKDAHDLLSTIVEKYGITHLDTLFNEEASYYNVKNRLKKLIGNTRPQDEVIIFFAGHGEYDKEFDEDGKWILADGRLGNASLATIIEKIRARHVLVLVDACFSGSFYLRRGVNREAVAARNKKKSRWIMASGRLEKVSDQMEGKQNSPFAWHLNNYLQNANKDVPLSELRDYLEREIPKVTAQHPIAGPVKGDEGGEYIFKIIQKE